MLLTRNNLDLIFILIRSSINCSFKFQVKKKKDSVMEVEEGEKDANISSNSLKRAHKSENSQGNKRVGTRNLQTVVL